MMVINRSRNMEGLVFILKIEPHCQPQKHPRVELYASEPDLYGLGFGMKMRRHNLANFLKVAFVRAINVCQATLASQAVSRVTRSGDRVFLRQAVAATRMRPRAAVQPEGIRMLYRNFGE